MSQTKNRPRVNQASMPRPIALITGGSSGIGLELAKLFARDNYRLILVARDKSKLARAGKLLQASYATPVKIIVEDLSLDSGAASVYAAVRRMRAVPDVLVNSAGFGDWGEFVKSDPARSLAMIKTNVASLTMLCRLIGADMCQRRRGKILNIASQAAFFPGPLMAVYYASKAYVLSFSEALAYEFKPAGVNLSVLCPPPTNTGFAKAANLGRSALFHGHLLSSEQVAGVAYRGLQKNKRIIMPNFRTRIQIFVARFIPRRLLARWVAAHQRRLY